MRWPKNWVTSATNGMVTRASRVRRALMRSMKKSAPVAVMTVLAVYMMAGPHSMRTACRSLVARAIRSPVGCSWKKLGGCRSRLAK